MARDETYTSSTTEVSLGRAQSFCRFATFPLLRESPPSLTGQQPFCRFATFPLAGESPTGEG